MVEKHEVMRLASEIVRGFVNMMTELVKSIIQTVKDIWENITKQAERIATNLTEHRIPEPRYVHPIVWDTRRNSQVMSKKPLSIVRRMNM